VRPHADGQRRLALPAINRVDTPDMEAAWFNPSPITAAMNAGRRQAEIDLEKLR
jgi:hypothetical protein